MPLLWLSLAFLLGILTAGQLSTGWGTWAAGAAGWSAVWIGLALLPRRLPPGAAGWAPIAGWPARRAPRLKFPPILLLIAFCLGGLRLAAQQRAPGRGDLAFYNGSAECRLDAWVADFPSRREQRTLLRLEVEAIDCGAGPRQVRGLAQGMLAAGADYAYGERLSLTGSPQLPPQGQDFSYRDYLAGQGVYTYLAYPGVARAQGSAGSRPLGWIFALRARGLALLESLYPAPEAQLLQGILLGVDERIPEEVTRAFQATGIAHVIAISGFNMSLLSALVISLFGRFLSRWRVALAAALTLAGYTLLVGGGPAVVRAALMALLALTAARLGRSAGGVNALALAAAGMCLFNPRLPWDVGFQLSFAATLGLLLYAGPLQGGFSRWAAARLPRGWGKRLAGPVGEYVLCTLAAQVTTLPVIAWHFQRISLSALLANPLVLPAQQPLMVLGLLSLGLGLLFRPLGQLFAWAAWPFAAWTVGVARELARLPGGELLLGPGGAAALLAMTGLLLLLLLWREKLRRWRLGAVFVLLPLLGLAGLSGRGALAGGDGRLHLVAFDLPGGPAFLLRDPRGAALLIGGADSEVELTSRLGRWLPPLGRLSAVLVPAGAGQKGLPAALERFQPARVVFCPDPRELKPALEEALRKTQIDAGPFAQGQTLAWGDARLTAITGTQGQCDLRLEYSRLRLLILYPAAVEWEGRALSPPPGGWLHLQSDGQTLWLEQGTD